MTKVTLELNDLKAQVEELAQRETNLKDDDLFVLWFIRAYVTGNDEQSRKAIAGGAGDKSVDAVYIDHAAKGVFIVQGKYRQILLGKAEARDPVIAFAQLAPSIADADDTRFEELLDGMEEYTAGLLREARKHVLTRRYRLWLYFVTTGRCSSTIQADANRIVRSAPCDVTMEVFDGRRVMLVLRDYLDGVAPPIPTLDLEMEQGRSVVVNQIMQRYDEDNKIESWVFSMRGDKIAELYELGGLRLFARNIRGFLGEGTPVNRGMSKTLRTEPAHFFYYNNGITILCDKAEKRSSKGRDVLRVSNPQVINGQQTTRTLAAHLKDSSQASVLVKVMQVPREAGNGDDGFDTLLSQIVGGTNFQNAIRPSDLMSNDRRQIEIERSFRKIGYIYLRKRQSKGDARRSLGGKGYVVVKSWEIAQAVAGCDLDPVIVRSGKENLFDEDLYSQVFPTDDQDYYLSRYWLCRAVSYGSKGRPQRGYAKWLALNFMWSQVGPLVRSRHHAEAFRLLAEHDKPVLWRPLLAGIDRVFVAVRGFYSANKGQGEAAVDISTFFRHAKGRHRQFEQVWNGTGNKSRAPFLLKLEEVREAIVAFER
jgi:hypothetical protein